ELLVGPRTRDGRPGYQLLTPLDTGGRLLLVDRGWVPYELDRPPVGPAAPPDQPVRLSGIVHDSRPPPRFGPQVPTQGEPDVVPRVDLPRLQPRFERPLYPVWLQLQEQVPPQADLPLPTEPRKLDEGNHLSYAMQWFAFAAIALVGYALLLGKNAQEERAARVPGADARQPEVAERRP
ncbi:MAG: SURF1 family protein, partial [Actinomycetota bacterium]|nr:SURF1 family protein [Actinomycetota bacterium]